MSPDSEPTPRVPWLPVHEGAQPVTPVTPEPVVPLRPAVPAWIRQEAVAEPVEDEAADAASPFAPPVAEEPAPVTDEPPLVAAEPPPAPPGLWNADAVQLLGQSAVENAALGAPGVSTPLAGFPTVAAETSILSQQLGGDAPLYTPAVVHHEPAPDVAPADGHEAQLTHNQRADALAAGLLAEEQTSLASMGAPLDGGIAYAPRTIDDAGVQPAHRPAASGIDVGDAPTIDPPAPPLPTPALPTAASPVLAPATPAVPTVPAEPAMPSGPRKRRWWLWVLLAVLLVGAIAGGYAYLNRPDAVVIPGTTVTQPPPTPTITPIAAPTATPFQAAMPTTVGTFSLVTATPLDPEDVALGAGRIADGVDLEYRSGDDTMKVRALQYYSEDDAKTMFAQFAGADAKTQPVEAGGTTVGESAIITSPKPGMVWRNGTSVFIVTGPLLHISAFYEDFGL